VRESTLKLIVGEGKLGVRKLQNCEVTRIEVIRLQLVKIPMSLLL